MNIGIYHTTINLNFGERERKEVKTVGGNILKERERERERERGGGGEKVGILRRMSLRERERRRCEKVGILRRMSLRERERGGGVKKWEYFERERERRRR